MIRVKEEGGVEQVIFHHVRNQKIVGRGGATFAMALDADRNVVAFAVAKCHLKDNFCKLTGRVKAASRLASPKRRIEISPQRIQTFVASPLITAVIQPDAYAAYCGVARVVGG